MTTVSALTGYDQRRAERSEAKPNKNYAADLQRQKRVESVQRLNASHAAAIDAIKNSTTRPNQKRVSQSGTLHAAVTVASGNGNLRNAKTLKKLDKKLDNTVFSLKEKTGGSGGRVAPRPGSLGAGPLQDPAKRGPTHGDLKHESSDPLRDGPTCKPRPDHRSGMGTSRVFVPWCEKRKH